MPLLAQKSILFISHHNSSAMGNRRTHFLIKPQASKAFSRAYGIVSSILVALYTSFGPFCRPKTTSQIVLRLVLLVPWSVLRLVLLLVALSLARLLPMVMLVLVLVLVLVLALVL